MDWLFFISFILLIIGGVMTVVSSVNLAVLSEYNKMHTTEYNVSKGALIIGIILLVSVSLIILVKYV